MRARRVGRLVRWRGRSRGPGGGGRRLDRSRLEIAEQVLDPIETRPDILLVAAKNECQRWERRVQQNGAVGQPE